LNPYNKLPKLFRDMYEGMFCTNYWVSIHMWFGLIFPWLLIGCGVNNSIAMLLTCGIAFLYEMKQWLCGDYKLSVKGILDSSGDFLASVICAFFICFNLHL